MIKNYSTDILNTKGEAFTMLFYALILDKPALEIRNNREEKRKFFLIKYADSSAISIKKIELSLKNHVFFYFHKTSMYFVPKTV